MARPHRRTRVLGAARTGCAHVVCSLGADAPASLGAIAAAAILWGRPAWCAGR